MTRLLLIRHGETDWNVAGRWQGQTDVPLNARGRAQAVALVTPLAGTPLTAIYSSDLSRARETAEILARSTGLSVQVDPRLREIDLGEWEGQLATDIQTRYADLLAQRRANPFSVSPPGGETAASALARARAALKDIVQRHAQGSVALISHGFLLALLRLHYTGQSVSQLWTLIPPNCEPVELSIESSGQC